MTNSMVAKLSICLILTTQIAVADQVFNDDLIVTGSGCIGDECVDGEGFSGGFDGHLKLKGEFTSIEFSDSSADTEADRDWRLRANLNSGGPTGESFFLEDLTAGTTPFYVAGGAPSNSLRIRSNGTIGIGTSLPSPSAAVHITRDIASLRLEDTTFESQGDFSFIVNSGGMRIVNLPNMSHPFTLAALAPTASLSIADNGDIGLGTLSPSAPLELSTNETFTFFRITAQGAAVNRSVDITYTGGPLGTGQLRYNIVEGIGVQTPEMTLDVDGNMVLTGTLTTTGPTCASGCDRVFDADYALPTITDHAEQMFAAGHLPSIGSTPPNAPVNLSEQLGNVINELEHAHIYINQLNAKIEALETLRHQDASRHASLIERLALVETQLAQ